MAISYGNYVNAEIANTTQQEILRDGVLYGYKINPNEGFVLHDSRRDTPAVDEMGNETGEIILGYTRSVSIILPYDFAVNRFGLYTIPESEVPDPDFQITGGGGNDHEIMSVDKETETK